MRQPDDEGFIVDIIVAAREATALARGMSFDEYIEQRAL